MSGLRNELKSSNGVTVQLQSQLQESVRRREREVHSITVERDNLHSKVHVCIHVYASMINIRCKHVHKVHVCICLYDQCCLHTVHIFIPAVHVFGWYCRLSRALATVMS